MTKQKHNNDKTEQSENHHPLGKDGLIDLANYLNNLPKKHRSLSGDNKCVHVEFEEYNEEIGKLKIWTVKEWENGVRAIFRNRFNAMPVTEYDDGLADETTVMNVCWDVDHADYNGIATLELHNKVDNEYPTIGKITNVDFGDDPTNPPMITLSVTGEWKRYHDRHDTISIFR